MLRIAFLLAIILELMAAQPPQRGVALPPAPSLSAATGAYYALIVGIDAYIALPPLATAVSDARSIETALRDGYGFHTSLLLNSDATRDGILRALNGYRSVLGANDNLLIYYAGHGQMDREAQRAYWLPVDSDASPIRWISADDIAAAVRAIPARHLLVISDSCYSGDLVGFRAPPNTINNPADHSAYLRKMIASKSRTFIASGGDEPVADGGASGHSIFTGAVLRGLRALEGNAFTAENLFDWYVREPVGGGSRQTPHFAPMRDSGHDLGDFVFLPSTVPAPPTAETGALQSARLDAATEAWNLVRASQKPEDFDDFAAAFPNSDLAAAARLRASQLKRSAILPIAALPPPPAPDAGGNSPAPGRSSNTNFANLVWRTRIGASANPGKHTSDETPLMVNGILYAVGDGGNSVAALDAATGKLIWRYTADAGETLLRHGSGPRLAYWPGGGHGRIIYVTAGYRLLALDAQTGALASQFGQNGAVDLKAAGRRSAPSSGDWAVPVVTKEGILVGIPSALAEFDAETGKLKWMTYLIPAAGEPGVDTWLGGSDGGHVGIESRVAVDEANGLVYVPVSSLDGSDGKNRAGSNLFSETLVALNLFTGKLTWWYQLTHHPVWGTGIASPPILMDLTAAGRLIHAVAQPTAQGLLFFFDRLTGRPIWPIEEKPVSTAGSNEPLIPTQPIPTRSSPFARGGVTVDDLIDFSPELRSEALTVISRYAHGPIYTPPATAPGGPAATLVMGSSPFGSNRPSASFDPESNLLYISACNSCIAPMPLPADWHPSLLTVRGLPLVKPPYGVISAIRPDTGEIIWQVPNGETPDAVSNSPALRGLNIPRTGQPDAAGILVTNSIVIVGDPQAAMLRAYDKRTGREVGAVPLPAPQTGSPIAYTLGGNQYIALTISDGLFDDLVALRLH